ncbi:unnamed protein product [Vicia faba]|uniref:Uncharacterized protein n=1 Tax=Vicia faba TaxID=3906 RepID=A0AAV1BET8_VICFA|nr:unnamed protein product [Vicia faba]
MFQLFLDNLIKAKYPNSGSCLNSEIEVLKCICLMGSECDETCAFCKMQCWPFLSSKRGLSWPLNDCIDLKWEFIRRKLLIRLHIRLGRCLANLGKIDEARENFIRSISFRGEVPSFHFPHFVLGVPKRCVCCGAC